MGQHGLHLSGIAFVVFLLGMWSFEDSELQSLRPEAGEVRSHSSGQLLDVPARLWQDPFDAVNRQQKAAASNGKSHTEGTIQLTPEQIRFQLNNLPAPAAGPGGATAPSRPATQADEQPAPELRSVDHFRGIAGKFFEDCANHQCEVIGVMVGTSPYAEAKESRIRNRLAVLSGLGVHDFAPFQVEHIGYLSLKRDDPQNRFKTEITIPFELFARNGTDRKLLLWIPEEPFAQRPLEQFTALRETLFAGSPGMPQQVSRELKIIGPKSSATLRQLVARSEQAIHPYDLNISFYSASATMPADRLLGRIGDEIDTDDIRDVLTWQQTRLLNTISRDDELVKILLDELALRNADPGCADRAFGPLLPVSGDWGPLFPPEKWCRSTDPDKRSTAPYYGYRNHIVLLSEWDTEYGRTLPRLINQEALRRTSGEYPDPSGVMHSIHRFGYVKGLDGDLPESAGDGDTKAKDNENLLETIYEPAEGSNQFDYLRRLTERIRRLDEQLQVNGDGQIRAFGILGSDVYDKLLILRALRRHFPKHLFFTNDLDARYLDNEHYPATRNLLIASSFGLELSPQLQYATPPFRSSYQTATYLAAQTIAAQTDRRGLQQMLCIEEVLQPRIFEVGRHRFFTQKPLNHDAGDSAGERLAKQQACLGGIQSPNTYHSPDSLSLHPREAVAPAWSASTALLAVISAGAMALLLLFVSRAAREPLASLFSRYQEFSQVHGNTELPEPMFSRKSLRSLRSPVVLAMLIPAVWLASELLVILAHYFAQHPDTHAGIALLMLSTVGLLLGLLWLGRQVLHLNRLHRVLVQDSEKIHAQGRCGALGTPNNNLWIVRLLLSVLIGIVTLIAFHAWMLDQPEVYALSAGVSVWPSEMIRLAAGFLSFALVCATMITLIRKDYSLELHFKLANCIPRRPDMAWLNATRAVMRPLDALRRALCIGRPGLNHFRRTGLFQHLVDFKTFLDWHDESLAKNTALANAQRKIDRIRQGFANKDTQPHPEKRRPAYQTWQEYRYFADTRRRFFRAGLATAVLFVFTLVVLFGFGDVLHPSRGMSAHWAGLLIGLLALQIPFSLLLFLVMDETRLVAALSRHLCHEGIYWPTATDQSRDAVDDDDLYNPNRLTDDIITVEFLAQRTRPTGNLIWYPMIIIMIILVSMSTRFDNYATPLNVIGLIGIVALIAISSAITLRRSARHARQEIIDTLQTGIMAKKQEDATQEDRAEMVIRHIKGISNGAFRRVSEDPVTQALAWLFSIATVIITEYYSVAGL